MVRLGQESEKYAERVQAMQATYEQRIQTLESRLQGTEQSTVLADRKGETNQGILAEIIDKMEAKVMNLE
jgi:ABC-type phosphate transport system auxiliary subunit